ncbi:MAG TPA: alpha-amylase [Myxococcales bacterium]|nr:alpha-amylase [Myxococcales bacterium]
MTRWANDAVFYHLYPLGACGAPLRNEPGAPPERRLEALFSWIGHWRELGVNALYLGPVFESSAHGYDTADFFRIDRRLGDWELFKHFVEEVHRAGIRVILDGVFHHVGRDFWAFRDVRERGPGSPYCGWFSGLRFDRHNRFGDPFAYDGWNGCEELVKLDLANPAVREHLFGAVEAWIRDFGIDGLRLDAADCIDLGFLADLAAFCRSQRSDFLLLGEVIHGDYRRWANPQTLDSTTNYECFKGLHSSFNDKNLFEIAASLRRQFAERGLYTDLPLYAFADNHDVDRVSSLLKNRAHLYPLYLLLFTMPGMPSIYYGSEWGLQGTKAQGGDPALRPPLPDRGAIGALPEPDLAPALARFARLRHETAALRRGRYREVLVRSEQLVFARELGEETVLVAVNASEAPASFELPGGPWSGCELVDLLDPPQTHRPGQGTALTLPPCWGRVMRVR